MFLIIFEIFRRNFIRVYFVTVKGRFKKKTDWGPFHLKRALVAELF
jgi:hypothetical protein